uniref:Uncharacterized protein n=1 Tax=Heterobasidion ambi-like virus 14 TaxID=3075968 RepID=A0AA95Z2B7_9VIRU|nr:hypothetical protein [Heterobasidion ambi-like virus 14]
MGGSQHHSVSLKRTAQFVLKDLQSPLLFKNPTFTMSDILFFVLQKQTSQKALTIFASKGLEGSIPSVMHDIPLIAYEEPIHAFSSSFMANHIGAFANAYEKQLPVVSLNKWRFFDAFKAIPFDAQFLGIPRVKTRAMKGKEEEQDEFFTRCGFTRAQSGQVKIFLGVPSPMFLKEAAPFLLEATTQCEKGITNMLGLFAFIKIVKAVKFIAHMSNHVIAAPDTIGLFFAPDAPTDRMAVEDDEDENDIVLLGNKLMGSSKSWDEKKVEFSGFNLKSLVSICDGIPTVLPLSKEIPVNVSGPVEECPFSEGIPIPYFHGSLIGDMRSVISFFQTVALPLFGPDQIKANESFQDFRHGCQFLESTKKGMALTHLVKCLELAIQCNRGIYFCIEGEEYCGSVIGGSDFSILLKNKAYKALSGSSFQSSMAAIKGHESHVRKLAVLLSDLKLKVATDDGEEVEKVTRKQLMTSRQVYVEIKRRILKLNDDAENKTEKDILELVEKCTFDTNYLAVTAEHVLQAFDQVLNPKKSVWPDTTPLYLPGCILTDSHTAFILSAFGRYAPSLLASKGDEVLIPKDDKRDDDPALQAHPRIPNQKVMDYVAYHMKPISNAAADLERVVKKRLVVAETTLKGGPAKSSGRFGGKEREVIWYGLAALLKDVKVEKKGKKRAAEGGDDRDPKRKKQLERAAEMFLESMW